MIRAVLIGAMTTLFCTAASASQVGQPGPYDVTVKSAIKYATPAADTLIECKPTARKGHFAGPFPAILLIHGGGWSGGTSAVGPGYTGYSGSWCQLWASWGFDAFSVGYRTTRQAPWPTQMVDVQVAIRYVRAHSAALNVNPSMIVVNGDSSGAQMAMIAGYSYRNFAGDLAGWYPGVSSLPQLVVSQFGPWTFGPSHPVGSPSVRAEDYARQMLQDRADGRTKAKLASTVFIQGTHDTLTTQCSQAQPAFRLLAANSTPAGYIAFNGGHEFTNLDHSQWATIVGTVEVRSIRYAYSAAHLWGVIPASESGPAMSGTDPTLPPGCK